MLATNQEHVGVNPADYISLGGGYPRGNPARIMSRSELKRFSWCPARWLAGAPDQSTDSTEWGSLLDCLLLTPDEFSSRYAVTPATYLADGKKKDDPQESKPWNWNSNACKAWRDIREAEGITCVKPDDYAEAIKAIDAMKANPKFAAVLKGARRQVCRVVDYTDSETGIVVPVKVLIDIVPSGDYGQYLGDLKTTTNAHPSLWAREVHKHWYDAQGALYLDAWNTCANENRLSFLHLKQENYPPYQTATQQLSPDFIATGRARYQQSLAAYCQCLSSGEWPDYDTERLGMYQADGFLICEPESYMVLSHL